MRLSAKLLLLSWLGLVGSAYADCDIIAGGLKEKIKEYTAFREKNQEQFNALIGTETNCQKQGATISAKVANLATAASCEAQTEVAGMDQQMNEIGEKCETHFKEINALQTQIHAKFNEVQTDLDEGMNYMKKSQILNEYCGPEIKATKKMVQSFLELEMNIVSVQARSVDGKTNYGKFKDTAKSLQVLSTGRHLSCGEMASTIAEAVAGKPAKGTVGKGSGAPGYSGHSTNSSSDVTGAARALRMAAESKAMVQAQKGGGGKVSAPEKSLGANGKAAVAKSQISGKSAPPTSAGAALFESDYFVAGKDSVAAAERAKQAAGSEESAVAAAIKASEGSAGAPSAAAAASGINSGTAAGNGVPAQPQPQQQAAPQSTPSASPLAASSPSPAAGPKVAENSDPFSDLPASVPGGAAPSAVAPAEAGRTPASSGVVALGEVGAAVNKDTSISGPEDDLFGRVKRHYQRTELFRSASGKKL